MFLSMLMVLALTGPSAPKQAKPKVELTCTPRMAMAGAYGSVTVSATVRIRNANEQLWCPETQWLVGGESVGTHEADCKPYEETAEGERSDWFDRKTFRFGEGSYLIMVKLVRGKQVLLQESCTVIVQ